MCPLVDVLVETKEYQELLFQAVEDFENISTEMKLVWVNFDTLQGCIHGELKLLRDWESRLETILEEVNSLELISSFSTATFLLFFHLLWDLLLLEVLADEFRQVFFLLLFLL